MVSIEGQGQLDSLQASLYVLLKTEEHLVVSFLEVETALVGAVALPAGEAPPDLTGGITEAEIV